MLKNPELSEFLMLRPSRESNNRSVRVRTIISQNLHVSLSFFFFWGGGGGEGGGGGSGDSGVDV